MDKRELRLEKIVELLQQTPFISVKDMAEQVGVSSMTIRRDVEILRSRDLVHLKNGLLMSCKSGKAIPSDPVSEPEIEYDLNREQQVRNSIKSQIGQFAASLVQPDDGIIIDTGSTTLNIVPCIPDSQKGQILCYNTDIIEQVQKKPNQTLAVAGGYFHPNTRMFESAEGISFISNIRANKVFISAAGVHENLGLTCMNAYEVPTKHAVLQSAAEHILVTDSSKFGKVCAYHFCNLAAIDAVITDKNISPQWLQILQDRKIKVYTV